MQPRVRKEGWSFIRFNFSVQLRQLCHLGLFGFYMHFTSAILLKAGSPLVISI